MRARVLIVEDDELCRESIRDLLRDEGFDVLEARNGREALELLEAQDPVPSVILLDLEMPVMDGWTLYRTLRQSPRLCATNVILTTAELHPGGSGSAEGAPLLGKPFRGAQLLQLLGAHAPSA